MPEQAALIDGYEAPADPMFVSALDAARLLNLSRAKVYDLLDSGEIKSRRVGTRRLVHLESLREFANDTTQESA